jgi:hypothetical protein
VAVVRRKCLLHPNYSAGIVSSVRVDYQYKLRYLVESLDTKKFDISPKSFQRRFTMRKYLIGSSMRLFVFMVGSILWVGI